MELVRANYYATPLKLRLRINMDFEITAKNSNTLEVIKWL